MKTVISLLIVLSLFLLTSCDTRDENTLTIKLNPSLDTIDVGSAYINPHVTVTLGNAAYPYDIIENTLDITQVGRYTITYRTEYKDVVKEITKTIDVVDQTPPTLSLKPGLDTIHVGDNYSDPGITAFDNSYQPIDIDISNPVDTSTAGTYIITYTATDAYDNETIITRYVTVLP
jgi:hypothetical protein